MRQYYVYILSYPNGDPFYVGKGCNGRIDSHEKIAKKGDSSRKSEIIRGLINSGCEVTKKIIYTTNSSRDAQKIELFFIQKYSQIYSLTNRAGIFYNTRSPLIYVLKSDVVKRVLSIPDAIKELANLLKVSEFTIKNQLQHNPALFDDEKCSEIINSFICTHDDILFYAIKKDYYLKIYNQIRE